MAAKQPFFMRFVEKQEETEIQTNVKAGADDGGGKTRKSIWDDKGLETMKYPSDGDDEPPGGWGW